MTTLPGTTSTAATDSPAVPTGTNRLDPAGPRPADGRAPGLITVVFATPEAIALRTSVEQHLTSAHGLKVHSFTADSILEAVLLSGGEGEASESQLVIAGVTQELHQLEPAVRSLRKVYPRARVILACAPEDEVPCRKARGWGANDYLILPVDAVSLQRCLGRVVAITMPGYGATVNPAAAARVESPAVAAPVNVPVARPVSAEGALPLAVQTAVMGDLLAGHADFVQRAIEALRSHMQWGGDLQFIAAAGEAAREEQVLPVHALTEPVMLPDQPTFGMLVLDPVTPLMTTPPALSEAAQWLATMLSISRRQEQLRSLAITDELSGAYNRRYFQKFMTGLLERARVNRFRVTVLLFDIDDFKKYNDTCGHASGDAIIRELIKLLRACTRPHDLVARIGGDEFAVVYWDNEAPRQPNSEHPRDVLAATERFRKAIKNHGWQQACNIQCEVSISGGMATFPWDADTLDMLMEKADQALLRAKRAGKNVILLHGGEASEEAGKGEA